MGTSVRAPDAFAGELATDALSTLPRDMVSSSSSSSGGFGNAASSGEHRIVSREGLRGMLLPDFVPYKASISSLNDIGLVRRGRGCHLGDDLELCVDEGVSPGMPKSIGSPPHLCGSKFLDVGLHN
jgi:hypothetical protein